MTLHDLVPTLELLTNSDDLSDNEVELLEKLIKSMFDRLSSDDKHLARLICSAQVADCIF